MKYLISKILLLTIMVSLACMSFGMPVSAYHNFPEEEQMDQIDIEHNHSSMHACCLGDEDSVARECFIQVDKNLSSQDIDLEIFDIGFITGSDVNSERRANAPPSRNLNYRIGFFPESRGNKTLAYSTFSRSRVLLS